MARFQQLQELITKVRLDLGEDPEVSRGRFTDTMLKRELNKVQNVLWLSYEWPFKFREWAVPLTKGERFYELPDEVEMEGIEDLRVKSGNCIYSIEFSFRNAVWSALDPNDGETSSYPLVWRLHEPDEGRTRSLIELWPTPVMDGKVYDPVNNQNYAMLPPRPEKEMEADAVDMDGDEFLLLRAARRCPEMQRNEDTCYLDDELIVAFVVAAVAERRQLPDAGSKNQYAGEILKRLRSTGTQQRYMSFTRNTRGARFNSSHQFGNKYAN